ncbi:Ubiquitin-protein ligase [Yamadazyma tenuis]|nr:Ubiquitin-protein ligase [Yamadazyma tenuis]
MPPDPQPNTPNPQTDAPNPQTPNDPPVDNSFTRSIHNLLRQTAQRFRGATGPSTEESTGTSHPSVREDDSSAIVITINYLFSDENNPSNPNRSGSLVLTLPNNSSTRNPRTLDEFISLATQMAYSTIVNGLQKEKKGLTTERFMSFPFKGLDEIEERDCSICLEAFEEPVVSDIGQEPPAKRRRVDKSSSVPIFASQTSSDSHGFAVRYLKDMTEELGHQPVQLPCKHVFGRSCVCEWLKSHVTCPLCREVVSKDEDESQPPVDTDMAPGDDSQFGILNTTFAGPNVRVVTRTGLDQIRSMVSASAARRAVSTMGSPSPPAPTDPSDESRATASGLDESNERGNEIYSQVINYFRRSMQEPLFPTEVSSRRTADGVETTSSGTYSRPPGSLDSSNTAVSASMAIPILMSNLRPTTESRTEVQSQTSATEEVLDFLNLRSLADDANTSVPPPAPVSSTRESSSGSGSSESPAEGPTPSERPASPE